MIVLLNKHETRRQRNILQKSKNSFELQAHSIRINLLTDIRESIAEKQKLKSAN